MQRQKQLEIKSIAKPEHAQPIRKISPAAAVQKFHQNLIQSIHRMHAILYFN